MMETKQYDIGTTMWKKNHSPDFINFTVGFYQTSMKFVEVFCFYDFSLGKKEIPINITSLQEFPKILKSQVISLWTSNSRIFWTIHPHSFIYNHNIIINYQMMHHILQTWPSNVCFASKTCFNYMEVFVIFVIVLSNFCFTLLSCERATSEKHNFSLGIFKQEIDGNSKAVSVLHLDIITLYL